MEIPSAGLAAPGIETRKKLYSEMLRIRMIEQRIADLYPEQEMRCPVHLCIGQEAVSAGVGQALEARDYVFSGHRSHGHYLAKGGDLGAMLCEIYGKSTGCSRGRGGSMHLIDLEAGFLGATPIVASTIPIAVGAAFSASLKGEDRVSAVFFGEGATEEGVFHESLNFAALKKLPVLFVCENNLYSVYSPLSVRQPPGRDLLAVARGHGVQAESGDGNDAVAVHRLAASAVRSIRAGEGPWLLEFTTYRWLAHVGPKDDDGLGYRPEGELDEWKSRCPLRRLEQELRAEGCLGEDELAGMRNLIAAEIDAAVDLARGAPFPGEEDLLRDIYAS